MTRPKSTAVHSADGLTLVETLIALAIITVIATVLTATLSTLSHVAGSSSPRRSELERLRALQTIADQLVCAAPLLHTNTPVFLMEKDPDHRDSNMLRFACIEKWRTSSEFRATRAVIKEYRVSRDAEDEVSDLVCRTQPLRGPGSLSTGSVEVVAEDVAALKARALVDGEWFEVWADDSGGALPQALEISLIWSDGFQSRSNSASVFIPAGNVVTSRLERSASGNL